MKLPPVPNEADRSPMAGPAYFDYHDMDAYGLMCYDAAMAEPCPRCFTSDNKVFDLLKAFDALRDLLIEAESSDTPDAEAELIFLQDFYWAVHAIVYANLKGTYDSAKTKEEIASILRKERIASLHSWSTEYGHTGTYACPICGVTSVHEHNSKDIADYRITQKAAIAQQKGNS